MERIVPRYTKKVSIPRDLKPLFWDHEKDVFLEKYVFRLLSYGNFDEIKRLYQQYPDETFYVCSKYPNIKRGVKFWIKYWYEKKSNP